jgi:hypothetical protein
LSGIDGATAARPKNQGLSTAPAFESPLSDVLVALTTEFFVEWQVADDEALARLAGATEQ